MGSVSFGLRPSRSNARSWMVTSVVVVGILVTFRNALNFLPTDGHQLFPRLVTWVPLAVGSHFFHLPLFVVLQFIGQRVRLHGHLPNRRCPARVPSRLHIRHIGSQLARLAA